MVPHGPQQPDWLLRLQQLVHPLEALDACAARYGEIFSFGGRKVYVSDPVAVRTIFRADAEDFRFEGSDTLRPLLGDAALVSQNGAYHRFQRRLQTPFFFGKEMKARWGPLICVITRQVMAQWGEGDTLLLRASMQDITLRIMVTIALGWRDEEQSERLIRIFKELLHETLGSSFKAFRFRFLRYDTGSWSTWGRFLRLRHQLDALIDTIIEQRRAMPDLLKGDILSFLLNAHDDSGAAMTNQELRDHLVMLLFAGHETTASALAWALYWLHASPHSSKQLFQELTTLSPQATPAAIDQLPYLTAVCEETLRITPIAAATPPRTVVNVNGFELGPYHIEHGSELLPCIYLVHHRKDLYPEPHRFLPERFLGQRPSPSTYFPFGGGNHSCLGAAFALFEMKLVLATLLSSLRFAFPATRQVTPVARGGAFGPPEWLHCSILKRINESGYQPSSSQVATDTKNIHPKAGKDQ